MSAPDAENLPPNMLNERVNTPSLKSGVDIKKSLSLQPVGADDDSTYVRERVYPLIESFLVKTYYVQNKNQFKMSECKEDMKHISDRLLQIAFDLLVADGVLSIPEGRSRIPIFNIVKPPTNPEDLVVNKVVEEEEVVTEKPKREKKEKSTERNDDLVKIEREQKRKSLSENISDDFSPKKAKKEKKVAPAPLEQPEPSFYNVEVRELNVTIAEQLSAQVVPNSLSCSFPSNTKPLSIANSSLASKIRSMILSAEDTFSLNGFAADVSTAMPGHSMDDIRSVVKTLEDQNVIFMDPDGDTIYKI